jgi:hypothetical protein
MFRRFSASRWTYPVRTWARIALCATPTGNKPHRPPTPPRQAKPGAEVSRLCDAAGRVQSCELRNDSQAGAGWDVMLLEHGEPLFSRRCVDEHLARRVAEGAKKDLLRTGWTEAERTHIERGDARC